jgi:hypothetical protein
MKQGPTLHCQLPQSVFARRELAGPERWKSATQLILLQCHETGAVLPHQNAAHLSVPRRNAQTHHWLLARKATAEHARDSICFIKKTHLAEYSVLNEFGIVPLRRLL